ncbi:MAG: sugar ABC transporter permease [Devosia sp.]|uniref:carbohydrate ABC transporter permease n=1 Tax=Devosia sp. TaxID=1871048 RepID=UPI0024CA5CFE|nr:sugar ABC transporter permease [Devosia sp.]UYN98957.1 MAG: sugar ABC transporter permease [Devosia sp.]
MRIRTKGQGQELAMLLPALIFITALIVVPFLLSVWFSFTDQRLVPRPIPTKIIGTTNYERMFADPLFWQAIGNTVLFALIVTPVQLAMSLGAALVLNSAIPFRGFFRSVAILPLLLPMTVIVSIWAVLFRIPSGPFNAIYQWFAGSGNYVDFLGNPSTAMLAIVALSAWATFPYQMLIYLAGLQDIPQDLYEAARLDGAKSWQRFRYITWPGLRNVNIFLLIITTVGALKLFTQVDILTKGGPNGATTTIIHYLFKQGYATQKIGYASAVAVFFFLAVTAIALLQRRVLKNEGEA